MTTESRIPNPESRAPDPDPRPLTPSLRVRLLQPDDASQLDEILHKVGIFYNFEILVAMELIHAALQGNPDYLIRVAEWLPPAPEPRTPNPELRFKKPVVGYVCFGHNPMTDSLYDLYWIAVHPKAQGTGVGRALLAHTEKEVRRLNGRGIMIETSGRPEYDPAQKLYASCGYSLVAQIPDFYKPGDPRLIYLKLL